MANRDVRAYLTDILESCDRILVNLEGATFEKFRDDLNTQDIFARRFEIIGEAVKHVPNAFREKHPEVEWRQAAAFRDVLAHDYVDIEIERLYYTAKDQLPCFRAQIAHVLAELEK